MIRPKGLVNIPICLWRAYLKFIEIDQILKPKTDNLCKVSGAFEVK